MSRWTLPGVVLTLGMLLAGCVPGGTLYYHPSMAGGKTVKHYCEQTPSVVNFQLGSLPGHALARKTKNGTVVLMELGSYFLPRNTPPRTWKTFHFATDRFAARDLVRNVTLSDLPYRGPDAPLASPATKRYYLQIDLPKSTPDRFELISPPVVVDGHEWPFPPIRFEYKLWIGIVPFNC
ncbi:MAG: hypothetical protein P8Y78_02400 [Acidihalobacter sp.]|jgi:hypothetical protein